MLGITDEVRGIVVDAIASVNPSAVRDGWLLPTHLGIMFVVAGAIPCEDWFKIAQHLAQQLAEKKHNDK